MNKLFKDMLPGLLQAWIKWAESHDWGGNAPYYDSATGELVVSGAAFTTTNESYIETFYARTPKELRDWAGY